MDDVVIQHLENAVASHGQAVCVDAQLTENILRDLCGPETHHREISAVVSAVREHVPEALRTATQAVPPTLGDRLVRRLTDRRAIDHEAARWAVRGWSRVLKVSGVRFSPSTGSPGGPAASQAFAQAGSAAARLAREAARIAMSIPARQGWRATALAAAASRAAAEDAGLPAQLIAEAEAALRAVSPLGLKTAQVHAASVALAATHPADAERLALSIDGPLRDHALAWLADALAAAADYDGAMQVAWKIDGTPMQMHTLARLAAAVADRDPGRATRQARRLAGDYWKAEALSGVAEVIIADDPSHAAGLIREAAGLARSIPDPATSAAALGRVARSLAHQDPHAASAVFDEAESLARSAGEPYRGSALGGLAIALAESDPGRALDIAATLPDDWYVTGEIAKVLAWTEPDRASRLARSISTQTSHLADVAAVLAETDPDCALFLVESIRPERVQAAALAAIARVLARTDAERAARLLQGMENSAMRLPDSLDKVAALTDIAGVWAGAPAAAG